jgi:hypothetical protein
MLGKMKPAHEQAVKTDFVKVISSKMQTIPALAAAVESFFDGIIVANGHAAPGAPAPAAAASSVAPLPVASATDGTAPADTQATFFGEGGETKQKPHLKVKLYANGAAKLWLELYPIVCSQLVSKLPTGSQPVCRAAWALLFGLVINCVRKDLKKGKYKAYKIVGAGFTNKKTIVKTVDDAWNVCLFLPHAHVSLKCMCHFTMGSVFCI